MISYKIRSTSLLNLINDLRNGLLIPDAYFQRNLVWREIHKKDFIKTILLGFPFPQIFISRGKVDVEKMATVSCIVDGQQRTNAVSSFINDDFDVDGRFYSQLSEDEKSNFLKYDVAIIELDLDNNDPKVKDIFQRINRTSNSLTAIEKLASEYATSDFMLTAKLLSDQIDPLAKDNDDDLKEDPNIPSYFYDWAKTKKISKFRDLFVSKGIFNAREISRKNHLMHMLNIMSSVMGPLYGRNEKAVDNLSEYTIGFIPDLANELVDNLELCAELILSLKIPKKSIYMNKTGFFSLVVALYPFVKEKSQIDVTKLKAALEHLELNQSPEFKLAMTEALNNRPQRSIRHEYIHEAISSTILN
ncbi:DUF262 domain-containing protein [Pantoea agglomerans]|uniref:DUF262 domain-containing protein n=1 Tax=Enterobacter agglomerans TaxID=549 RepID=UPI00202D7F07|nr:DUF262 domain-containing protein [Pantoea agglomerans]MCL6411682.1 DUF262 domain-containing protein [Pantoea agglomerans]